jgi:hypothetical protein
MNRRLSGSADHPSGVAQRLNVIGT